ncbi:5'-methylthioadenosine/adenosylhomocysteine nucleosidase [Halalkalibacterium ligniniphilum]|uniref:5'-methylthioadenosine/adenosylhomocysteine nucleosidase n=1 Tax=Halalkalibacterium ligniniphilum TaxID=1134413 RepID=UPI000348D618|nr:5'-methylthioadenosine/adenosylhomocysteine nucleosidase [Halalkalibacterium ligniniphilum]
MKIGIIGAMNEEIERIKMEMSVSTKTEKASFVFYEGIMHDQIIVLVKSGVGKVNAAVATQILIDTYEVTHLIFTGVAGALDPSLEVGDIVISTSAMQHDLDASPLGFKQGEVPMFERSSDFLADESLVNLAEQAAKKQSTHQVLKGRILSGDQFIANHNKVQELYQLFDGKCVEMEGAAVAHVATLSSIPFVIIRSISDKANGEATMSFTTFTDLASERSHVIVDDMLKHMKKA